MHIYLDPPKIQIELPSPCFLSGGEKVTLSVTSNQRESQELSLLVDLDDIVAVQGLLEPPDAAAQGLAELG
jgi:hypothetical protein